MDVRPEDAPAPGEVPGEAGATAAAAKPRRRPAAGPRLRTRKSNPDPDRPQEAAGPAGAAEASEPAGAAEAAGATEAPEAAGAAGVTEGSEPAGASEAAGATDPAGAGGAPEPTEAAGATAGAEPPGPLPEGAGAATDVAARATPTRPRVRTPRPARQPKRPKAPSGPARDEQPAADATDADAAEPAVQPAAPTDAAAPAEPAKPPTTPKPPRKPRAPRRPPASPRAGRSALTVTDRLPASPITVPSAKVALSTSSVYPESVAAAFEIARRLGYDGIELMVFTDPVSQDPDAIRALSDYHGIPVLSVHAPCLLVTQRVWSTDPWEKLRRSQAAAERLGAQTVVVHPPFRWQRDYGRDFERGLAAMRDETDVVFAVENMYPWRARNREWAAYLPDWDPRNQDYPQVTLDLSHTAVSGTEALVMAADLGDRLAHVHLADGTGLPRDEHLVPGRGNQQCDSLLEGLAASGFTGTIVVEVSTRKAANRAEREADLAEALAFARLHLAAPVAVPVPPPPA